MHEKKKKRGGNPTYLSLTPWPRLWKFRFPGASPEPRITCPSRSSPGGSEAWQSLRPRCQGWGIPQLQSLPVYLSFSSVTWVLCWAPARYLTSLQCCFLEGGERWRESCPRPALPSALGLESCCCQPRPPWVDSCPPSARPCFPRDPTVQAQSCAHFCG